VLFEELPGCHGVSDTLWWVSVELCRLKRLPRPSGDGDVPKVREQDLERLVGIIVETVAPCRIILFGSQARGEATTVSDIDLLIVESEPFDVRRSRRKELARLWRVLSAVPIAKDILVYSHDEVEYWKDSVNSVVARALREGRVLYERP
jgi:uncharacterized protein